MTLLLGMYDPAVSIKFREAKKFLKFKISWLMPLIIFINGQFLEKLCIGNWACVSDDSVSRQSTGWRFTVTHIGRPPTSAQCALCSCPQGAHCACILLCIEIPKPTNVQPVAKHFVVRRIWKWVKLKEKDQLCVMSCPFLPALWPCMLLILEPTILQAVAMSCLVFFLIQERNC